VYANIIVAFINKILRCKRLFIREIIINSIIILLQLFIEAVFLIKFIIKPLTANKLTPVNTLTLKLLII
jgi:hypothetical protein